MRRIFILQLTGDGHDEDACLEDALSELARRALTPGYDRPTGRRVTTTEAFGDVVIETCEVEED